MFCHRCNATYFDGGPDNTPEEPNANTTPCKMCGLTEQESKVPELRSRCEECKTLFSADSHEGPTCLACKDRVAESAAPPKRGRGRPRKQAVPA